MKRLVCVLLLGLSLLGAGMWSSAATDNYVFAEVQQQVRFYALLGELRCVVCQNQTLADSNAPLAADLREEVYRLLGEGKTNAEITDYLVTRYGDFVLYNPPFKNTTYLLWLAPFFCLIIGAIIIVMVVRRQRRAL